LNWKDFDRHGGVSFKPFLTCELHIGMISPDFWMLVGSRARGFPAGLPLRRSAQFTFQVLGKQPPHLHSFAEKFISSTASVHEWCDCCHTGLESLIAMGHDREKCEEAY
jgi:hypothetical protein